jgi:hypothetical protein
MAAMPRHAHKALPRPRPRPVVFKEGNDRSKISALFNGRRDLFSVIIYLVPFKS